jgi:hypothetical protein
MDLSAIRSLARPRLRAFRRTILSTLGMAAIVLGLLAMHSFGTEHASVADLPAASAHTGHAEPADAPMAVITGVDAMVIGAAATTLRCDEACMQDILDCAVMVMTCAMILAVAALIVFARRPGLYRTLQDTGGRIVAALPRAPLHIHRPNLIVLSISRT